MFLGGSIGAAPDIEVVYDKFAVRASTRFFVSACVFVALKNFAYLFSKQGLFVTGGGHVGLPYGLRLRSL
jgi:hypothetical protein